MRTENNNFKMGIRDGMAVALGYIAISFGFGIISVSSGLSWYESLFISMFNLTSAGQLAAVPIFASGGTLAELALSQVVINSRYALMSVSLSQRFGRNIGFLDKLLIGFANTDEIYAVAIGRGETLGRKYMLGLIICPYIGWSVGTLLGALAGNILPELLVTALSVSLYAMFIAILVPAAKRDRRVLICIVISMAVSSVLTYVPVLNKIPSGFRVVICTVAVSALLALLAPIADDDDEEEVRV